MTRKGNAIFKENLISGLKNDIRILFNFHNLHFDGLVLSKGYKFLDKKVQKSMSHDTEE